MSNIANEMKKLKAGKTRSRSNWQRTHTPRAKQRATNMATS